MSDDTKFPESTMLTHSFFYLNGKEVMDNWFKKCMADFPIMFSGKRMVGDVEVYATMEIPDVVLAWFNKWFSQFVEGG